ncbi:ABC transporter ATP-binding protein [Carboxydochorda subterranea]|uniref:ABC transporter ATP-binding protein n=1 Tax=Carboxydichorda subterranea TaxID=3109565 RepID=A0ABZ1BX16_9FIRM|nr:ABC transporter ATP-binding protein [Limnochorda sp. L945t]WRP17350.1 ABC transporter ATP-binding protein [Limnochorda sp. L945t]
MDFIEIAHLFKEFPNGEAGWRPVLWDLSLSVRRGEFAVLLGPSGCGKTTLLHLIAGLDRHYRGSLTRQPGRIAFVFQEPRLLPWLTVEQNLRLVCSRERPASIAPQVESWLRRVGLERWGRAYPHQLSVGMQQRAALARAFVIRPDLLLLDEPFSALDEVTAEQVADRTLQLWLSERPTVLMVTHRVEEAVFFADRVWILTPSPATVHARIDITLPRPRSRTHPEYWQEVARVRHAVHDACTRPATL